jgi:glucose-6-phosphate dehydrogenase assembly protein OpcA
MTISPDRILKELAQLWKNEGAESGTSVLRACAMTLIVVADESAAAIGETIAALMPEHPARAIHIRIGGSGRALSERVYQQCWMPFGQRRQVCCEQVEITAADDALGDLPSVVLPLAVADLPVILWCRSPRLLGMPEFRQMAAIATKVIVDSSAMPDPQQALRRMASVVARGVPVADLAWTRLTRWRETLSQVFENRERLAQLGESARVTIDHGPGNETAARYMGAWIQSALPAEVSLRAAGERLRVELVGENLRVELACNDGALTVKVNELEHCAGLSQATDYLLLREELRIVRRDPIFERTLEAAAK